MVVCMNPIERLLEYTGELDKEAQDMAAKPSLARAWRMRVVCEQIREALNEIIIKLSGD